MPTLTSMKTKNTRGGQPGVFGDETVTRGNVNVKEVSNVLGHLGDMGGRAFSALSPVSLWVSPGQTISVTKMSRVTRCSEGGVTVRMCVIFPDWCSSSQASDYHQGKFLC